MEGGVDRISSLPDSILAHILSFLPTNVAVSTCILLTRSRWRELFPFSNKLDFDQSLGNNPNDTRLFMDFVDRFIMLMNGTSIDKFRLKCGDDVDKKRVHSWIAPLLCIVRELDLCIGWREPREEYSGLFNLGSNTLVVLKLEGFGFSLNVVASVCFPCLKTLHLQSITLAKKDSPIQCLVSNCPVLEDLLIARCYMEGVPVLSLSSPSLKRLTIHDPHYCYPYKLVLDTPSLAYLKFNVWKQEVHILKNLRSLREAHISTACLAPRELLEGLGNIQSLYLSGNVEKFFRTPLEVVGEPPLLKNVTRLVLKGICSLKMEMSVMMKLLQCCPNLEEFVSNEGCIEGGYDAPCNVPSRLKSIEYRLFLFKGTIYHKAVESLEYFLKNANMLEKMKIHIWYNYQNDGNLSGKMMETLKKLTEVPRRSQTCEVHFFFHGRFRKAEDQVCLSKFCDFNSINITFVIKNAPDHSH